MDKKDIGKLAMYNNKICRILDYDKYFNACLIRRQAWTGRIVNEWHPAYMVDVLTQEEIDDGSK